MIRWRCCLVLAMLLILPTMIGSKLDDEDEDESREDADEDEEEDDDDDEEPEQGEKSERIPPRRSPALAPTPKTISTTEKKRPLECYVCAYKADTPLRACLDPTKFRVHTITCHSSDDKCFTSVISKSNSYEAVVRGCRSGCVGSTETTCCELNRCNNQAFALPVVAPLSLTGNDLEAKSKVSKNTPSSILFFVTILLVLQTVVKVPFV